MAKQNTNYTPPTMTKWTNGHDSERCRFQLMILHGSGGSGPKVRSYEIKPGETVEIESTFDDAIQVTDADGWVTGGKAPWLTKNGKKPKLVPALDWISQREELALQREMERIREEQLRAEAKARLADKTKKV